MQNNSRHGIVIISYTGAGAQLQEKLGRILGGMVPEEDVYQFGYRKAETDFSDANSIAVFSKTEEILDQHFDTAELIVFISATGIAVRKIAPYLKSKTTDPAVLCMDEMGRFVIPLVSGHLGGANAWAQKITDVTGAVAVITTATDIEKVFAVDLFAKKNHLRIIDTGMIKEVSARILAGEPVGICSDRKIEGDLPEGLIIIRNDPNRTQTDPENPVNDFSKKEDTDDAILCKDHPQCGITITADPDAPKRFAVECRLLPDRLVLGIGCRKGKDPAALKAFVSDVLAQYGLSSFAIARIASVDVKKEEPALLELAKEWKVPLETFSAQQLQKEEGTFSASAFVAEQVGVDNVCERSAVCAAGPGAHLLVRKTARDGMTLAIAAALPALHF